MTNIVLSSERIERVELVFKTYWYSPFCTGTILLGEPLLSWALDAEMLDTKAYADAYDKAEAIAYQIKTGLPASPLTFARLTTPSQFQYVNSTNSNDLQILADELLGWVQNRIQEPVIQLGAKTVHIARIIYTKSGDFIYYEREANPSLFNSQDYTVKWSQKGNALELHRNDIKWFSWYPQGRRGAKNQNQLHFHGENQLIPAPDSTNRIDFSLGEYGRISFGDFVRVLNPLMDKFT